MVTKKKVAVAKDPRLSFVKEIAGSASKIKALNIKIMDLRKLGTFANYFVIASGSSDRQVEAIADTIIADQKKNGHYPIGAEGYGQRQWVIVDYGDVVVHVFYKPIREVYAIEKVWADAKMISFRQTPTAKKASPKKKKAK